MAPSFCSLRCCLASLLTLSAFACRGTLSAIESDETGSGGTRSTFKRTGSAGNGGSFPSFDDPTAVPLERGNGGSGGGKGRGGSGGGTSTGVDPQDGVGIFVAVGYGGRRIRSIDGGATWEDDQTLVPNGGDDDKLLRAVAYGKGQFVAVGYRTMTSPDGKTWVDKGLMSQWLGGVAYGKNLYAAVGGVGRTTSSTDGFSWTDTANSNPLALRSLAFGDYQGGRWVSIGDNGAYTWSDDGKTWKPGTGETPTGSGAAFGANRFVACGSSGIHLSSDGGAVWSKPSASACEGVAYGQGTFLVTSNSQTLLSPDGETWSSIDNGGSGRVTYGGGYFVAIRGGGLWRTADGSGWTSVLPNTGQALERIAYGVK